MIVQPQPPDPQAARDARTYASAATRSADRVIDSYSTSFGAATFGTTMLFQPVGRVASR